MREGKNIPPERIIYTKELRQTGLHLYMRALRELLDDAMQLYPRYSKKGDYLDLSNVNFKERPELKSLAEVKGQRALINLIHAAEEQGFIEFVDNQGQRVNTHPTEMPNRISIRVSTNDSKKFLREINEPTDSDENSVRY